MELDLDAFIDSHATDEDDDDDDLNLQSVRRRTVDEILLNDSSSSSSSAPSSPNHHRLNHGDDGVNDSIGTPDHHTSSSSYQFIDKPIFGNSDVNRSTKSVEFADSLSLNHRNRSSVLPALFGGGGSSSRISIRSNVKPGAALAAAAAASRSVPTPHAAAIKLRRATTASTVPLQDKVVGDSNEVFVSKSTSLDSEVVSELLGIECEVSSGTASELGKSDFNNSDSFQTGEVVVANNGSSSSGIGINIGDNFSDNANKGFSVVETEAQPKEMENVSETNEPTIQKLEEVPSSSPSESHTTPSIAAGGQNWEGHCINLDKPDVDVNIELPSVKESIDEASEYHNKRQVEEDLTFTVSDEHLEDVIPQSKEEEQVSLAGKDVSSPADGSEPDDDIILHPQNMRSSKMTTSKSNSFKKPLDLAEELEKKYAFTGLHWEEGAASQPMRLEGMRRGSTVLGYFAVEANNTITRTISSEAFKRDHGSAQVLAVHHNFIAVGMSKGVIVRFPSKQPPHPADNDSKIAMLGIQGDKSHVSVTAMCFNRQGDLLFAGYADGHCTVWDIHKATALKVISEHKAPIVHMLYLGQDSQVSRQFNVVTGDSKGVVKLIRFSIVPWVNRISVSKPVPLLDESTSTVICASPLVSDEYSGGSLISTQGSATVHNSSISGMMGGVVGGDWKLFEGSSLVEEGVVIFVTHQSALVAKVNPSVEVYAQLPKPDGVREGSMPYAAWKYTSQPSTSSDDNMPEKALERIPLLALAWDQKVLVAKLVKSELKIYGKWSLESSALGVAWLDDQLLVVLTSNGQLCLFGKDGTVIHQTSFSVDEAWGDDLIAYHTQFTNIYGNPEKAYHNCIALRGASIYILGPMHLAVSRLLPWKERIEVLRKAGDWMGALNMAISLYDGQAHGVIDLPRTLDDVQKAVMPYLVELLLSYVDEVFSYMSVAFSNQIGKLDQLNDLNSRSSSVHSEIQEQFTRVGGVAVEFCVHIKRTDILFDEIFSRFVSVRQKETFLELMEPYILKDMLGSLPPEIMQALVEHYSKKGWLQRVEQCVLHMDISSLDFNQVVRLCREHRLYGALIYLFNKGLDDFRAPLEELLAVLKNRHGEIATSVGYRMLVYLKYCFEGLAFPPGHGILSPERRASVRVELIQFLLEDSDIKNSCALASSNFEGAYRNLYHLLVLDTEATLDVLSCAFVEDEISNVGRPLLDSTNSNMDSVRENDSIQNMTQKMVDVLSLILDKGYSQMDSSISNNNVESNKIWPSKNDIIHVIEFIAYYVLRKRATVTKNILSEILEYLISTSDIDIRPSGPRQNLQALEKRDKKVLGILKVVPETDWDASYLLNLCEKAQFYQVCGFIYAMRHQNIAALESYMKVADEPIHAFSFISYTLLQLDGTESDVFQSVIMSRVPDLVKLSRAGTFFLVVEHFNGDNERILSELESDTESLFLYLKTVIEVHSTGTLNFSGFRKVDNVNFTCGRKDMDQLNGLDAYLERISDFPKFIRNNPVHVTDKIVEQYLELLCQYEPSSVLLFLKTFENYRVEQCLRLCQNYGIVDAAAFLLERVGDVGTALSLTLSSLNDKFPMLDASVCSLISDASTENFNSVLQKEVNDILDLVHACIGLCQRNSPRMDFDESESLWFGLLDSFCEPLMDLYNPQMQAEGENSMNLLTVSLHRDANVATSKVRWKMSSSQKGAHILRKLFSFFIKEIVEGMIGYVRLPTIMMKLLSDNGNQEFGDFKLTILGMLGTYDFERRILDTAKSLIEDDTFYTMSLLKKGVSHGYGSRNLLCCICNCPLTKNSTSSRIQVYNCGHTTHLQCELQEKEASQRSSSAGCPICIPKSKIQKSKSQSFLVEDGLVSSLSVQRTAQGTGLHPYESETFDGSHGHHPISRFEILVNLQKDQILHHVENMPQLRLAPPALYHEKVRKGIDLFSSEISGGKVKKGNNLLRGKSSDGFAKMEKSSKGKQFRELKMKGTSLPSPLKSNIFGKEKIRRR